MGVNFNSNSVPVRDYGANSIDTPQRTNTSISKSAIGEEKNIPKDFDVVESENIPKDISEQDEARIREAVEKINREFQISETRIKFKIHEGEVGNLNRVSIKVIDESNDKVIMEIPSEEVIEFSKKMREIIGVLFDKRK